MADPDSVSGEGLDLVEGIARAQTRAGDAQAGALVQPAEGAGGLPLKVLMQTNPEYDARYWRVLRAFYQGGKALLRDKDVLNEVFPKHRKELDEIYLERCKRAFYVNYAAEILDHIVAGLASDQLDMALGDEGAEGQKDLSPWYTKFCKDVSPRGGKTVTLNTLIKEQVRTALQLRTSWTLVELPLLRDAQGDERKFADVAEQEKAGALDAYAVTLEPESVIDWEEDSTGALEWAVIHTISNKRKGVTGTRDQVTLTWMVYTPADWTKYELTYVRGKEPPETTLVPMVAQGPHTFGSVPLRRLQLPDGLWAMNKMEGTAREHFNKRSALGWGETQSLLAELYEFLGAEAAGAGQTIGAAQEDPNRAVSGPRGQGYVQVRGEKDRAEFVGPNVAAFAEARSSCDGLRDDMHRVMHQMALSLDNSAASVGRSAESKAQDKAAVAAVLTELGRIAREHAEAVFNLVSQVRSENDLIGKWQAQGMATFDAVAVSDAIEQALSIDVLAIESPTFRKRHRTMLTRAILGDEATPEDLEQIVKELEEHITDESVVPPTQEERAAMDAELQGEGENVPKKPKAKPVGAGKQP